MLKAAGHTKSGRPLLVLGLDGENMTQLMAGEPMLIHAHTLGLPNITVVVIGGKTIEAIRADVEQHMTGALADKFDEPDRAAAYRAARAWAVEHGHPTPDDLMIDTALDAANL
jgi:hypothetical protein